MLYTSYLVIILTVFGTWGVMFSIIYAGSVVKKALGATLFLLVIGWLLWGILSGRLPFLAPSLPETSYEIAPLIYVESLPQEASGNLEEESSAPAVYTAGASGCRPSVLPETPRAQAAGAARLAGRSYAWEPHGVRRVVLATRPG